MKYLTRIMNQIADRLRQLRGEQTQAEFARQLNMQRPQLANYETGKNVPSADFVYKVCEQTGASADWLLGLKDRNDTPKQTVSVKVGSGGIAIGRVGNRVSGTIVAGGDAGHAAMCRSCPYRKKMQAMEKVLGK